MSDLISDSFDSLNSSATAQLAAVEAWVLIFVGLYLQ